MLEFTDSGDCVYLSITVGNDDGDFMIVHD